jgi:hypothetical protein
MVRSQTMRRFLGIIFLPAALAIAPADFTKAETSPGDITVVSVLTMAKELAGSNFSLRIQVAARIEHAGQQNAFATYMADVAREVQRILRPDARNQELIDEAKLAFSRRDSEKAKELMLQCRVVPVDRCGADLLTRRAGLAREIVFQVRFLNWELEAKDFEAAERRLRATDWKDWRTGMIVRVASANIAAGRRSEGMEILRLLGRPESDLYSCILDNGPLGDAAVFRKMACEGKERDALDMALALDKVSARIHALGMIAEGLAGIPGSSFETLRQF